VNDTFERMKRGTVVMQSVTYSGICMNGLRNTRTNLSSCPNRGTNVVPPEFKSQSLLLQATSPIRPSSLQFSGEISALCSIKNRIYIYIYIYIYIQGVTGGTDQTSGGCSLC
jgi:hypothetical protein